MRVEFQICKQKGERLVSLSDSHSHTHAHLRENYDNGNTIILQPLYNSVFSLYNLPQYSFGLETLSHYCKHCPIPPSLRSIPLSPRAKWKDWLQLLSTSSQINPSPHTLSPFFIFLVNPYPFTCKFQEFIL